MTEKNECTHENAGTQKYCPDCGALLKDESIERFGNIIEEKIKKALEEYGMKKQEKKTDKSTEGKPEARNEFERITGVRSKK